MSPLRTPPRQSLGWWSRTGMSGPAAAMGSEHHHPADTQVPANALPPLDSRLVDVWMETAAALGQTDDACSHPLYRQGYRDGKRGEWWWGVACGACLVSMMALGLIGLGLSWGALP